MASGQFLIENPEARHYHQAGLSAALAPHPDLSEAMTNFKEAQFVLQDIEPTTVDSGVQLARVWRDMGFTIARKAVNLNLPNMLNPAQEAIRQSARITEVAVSNADSSLIYDPAHKESGVSRKHLRREVFAEHGATLGLMGRLVTVEEIMLDTDTRGDSEEAVKAREEDQAYYGAAHDFLRIGNNGYYRVSNAMAGARQERINGQAKRMLPWLGRAAYGLAWTALHDRRNLRSAAGTVARRFVHLRSYEAALESALAKP